MKENISPSLIWVYALLTTICLSYLYLASFIQPITDDYCYAYYVSGVDSIWANVSKDWNILNGRWGTSAMRYIFMSTIGIESSYWLTIPLSLLAILGASYLISCTIIKSENKGDKFALASINSLIFLSICSSLSDVVFWGTGLTDYTLGYLMVSVCIYTAYHLTKDDHRPSIITYLGLIISTALACSFAELFIVPVWVFLVFCFFFGKNKLYLSPIIVLMIIATGFNILAPGNTVRSERVVENLALVEFIKENLVYGLRGLLLPFLGMYLISYLPGINHILLKISDDIENNISKKIRLTTTLFIIGFPILLITILLISLNAPGPGRAHNISLFAIISAWPIVITIIKPLMPMESKKIFFKIPLIFLGILVLAVQNNKDIAEDILTRKAQKFNQEVTKTRNFLQEAHNRQQHISLRPHNRAPSISSDTDYLVTEDKNYWINKCVSLYYDLKSIDAKPVN